MIAIEKRLNRMLELLKRRPIVVASGIICGGLVLRLLFPLNTVINFDQVQILENSAAIMQGDLTLIGPRTGPASMFTGPLIYYLSAPFVAIFGDVASILLVPALLSLITGIVLFWLTNRYIGQREALLVATFWAFSPVLITHDKTLWNPSLLILSSALLFIPLPAKKQDRVMFPLLMTGSFLSFQAHFSGFFLIALSILSVALLKKPIRLIAPIILGFCISILPTILFDLRNDFLNARGLLDLLGGSGAFSFQALLASVMLNVVNITTIFGDLFFLGNSQSFVILFGVLALLTSMFFWKRSPVAQLTLVWTSVIVFLYALYSGEKPEYYYYLLVPALLLLSSQLIPKLGKWATTFFLLLFIANSVWMVIAGNLHSHNLTLGVLSTLRQQLSSSPPSEIVYDIPLGSDFGARYMMKDVPLSPDGPIVHITYPNTYNFSDVTIHGDVAVWIDHRTGTDNFITKNEYILKTPASIFLFSDTYPAENPPAKPTDMYVVVRDGILSGQVMITKAEHTQIEWVQQCRNVQSVDGSSSWMQLGSDQHCAIRRNFVVLFKSEAIPPDEIGLEVL